MKHKFAAQLYTLRNEIQNDFPSTLRVLKKMGWEAVQIDGLYGYSPEEIAGVLNETGLKTAGMHVSLDRLKHELDEVLKEARLFQTSEIILPYLDDHLKNEEGYKNVRKDLLAISKKAVPQGCRIGYHHHDFEFQTRIDGEYALDYLLAPPEVFPEIDTYWVKKAGLDPLSYIRRFPNQMPILHLKDMTSDGKENFAEIGAGCIDFEPILKWGEQNGVEWYAVEQDICAGSPFDSLDLSLANLIKMTAKWQTNKG